MIKINPDIRSRIEDAAMGLVAEGVEEPTNSQVLDRMGKGSLTHVSPVMREWRESRRAKVGAALEMPADLRKAMETSLSQVWLVASKMASAGVEQLREESQARIDAADRERDEALSEIGRLEAEVAALKAQLAELNTKAEKAGSQLSKLRTENAALAARVDDRNIQIDGMKTDLREARADNKSMQVELVNIAKNISEQAKKGVVKTQKK